MPPIKMNPVMLSFYTVEKKNYQRAIKIFFDSFFLSILESAVPRKYDRLSTRPHAELIKQVCYMIPNGLFANGQSLSNFSISQSFRHQRKDLAFPSRQFIKRRIAFIAALPKKAQHFVTKTLPSRFLFEEHVVPRVQFDKL